jgi:hypothetical protein
MMQRVEIMYLPLLLLLYIFLILDHSHQRALPLVLLYYFFFTLLYNLLQVNILSLSLYASNYHILL